MHRTLLCAVAACAIGTTITYAQGTSTSRNDQSDSTLSRIGAVEKDVNSMKATKIGGYIQAEWQHYDQSSSAGGRAYYSNSRKNLFTVRRGRLKATHKFSDLMGATLEADFTERGVAVKDAFMALNILPDEALTMNVGLFAKPEYEVELSSSVRESPEHSQIALAFYPAERDLGLMFTTRQQLFENFAPRLQLGIFNGEGVASEVDPYKDIITRLTFPLPLGSTSPVKVDLGASFYYGGIPQTGTHIIKSSGGETTTVENDATGSMAGWGNRQNVNVESQIYLDVLPFGQTVLKGEFMTGKRPTAATSGTPAAVAIGKDSLGNDIPVVRAASAGTPLQIRNQSGYYAYFIQNFGKQFQIVAKYDFYDRNTDLAGSEVKSVGDVASGVLGFGFNAFYNNMRFTAFYEIPSFGENENGTEDVKDNKTTVRFQYKF